MLDKAKEVSVNLVIRARSVRLRQFLAQPILFAFPLVILYIAAAVGFGVAWYGYHSSKPIVGRSLQFFPFPAALVNGGVVWSAELNRQLNFVGQFSEKTGQSEALTQQAPPKIFDRLIENKMVAKEAERAGVRVSAAELNDAYKQVADRHGGQEEVAKVLANLYGMKPADFKKLIAAELIKQQIRDELILNIKLRHILVKDESRAKQVIEKLKGGATFEDVAKEFSEDKDSRDKGGELGFIHRGQINDAVFNAAAAATVGQFSEQPVKSDIGFHVIRVDERRGSVDKTYDDWFNELKAKARVIRFVKA
ncbi:peptidylprolyl isomerase [Candidatus Berkelbacteria bacterium]|nr:peptidylprolyl isomerase [Candidatus Berkelbacteria bacterium]